MGLSHGESKVLGIESRHVGCAERRKNRIRLYYTATPYSVIRATLERIGLRDGDVLVDIGCAKARPLLWAASRYHLERAVGIELNPILAEEAIANAKRLRKALCSVDIYRLPAQEYDYADATAIYMYNPFGEDIMHKVLTRLAQSIERSPRSLRIAYLNDDIVDHCCYAWNQLTDQPWTIMSIGMRDWAQVSQSQ